MIDVLISRYCPTQESSRLFDLNYDMAKELGEVYVWDNGDTMKSNKYIGLVKASIKLIEATNRDYFLLMNHDFTSLHVDIPAMVAGGYNLSMPGNGADIGWAPAQRYPCTFMLFKREAYLESGGFNPRFLVAYADWDLIHRMKKIEPIMIHHPSYVKHKGNPMNEEKRSVWDADRKIFNELWEGPP